MDRVLMTIDQATTPRVLSTHSLLALGSKTDCCSQAPRHPHKHHHVLTTTKHTSARVPAELQGEVLDATVGGGGTKGVYRRLQGTKGEGSWSGGK